MRLDAGAVGDVCLGGIVVLIALGLLIAATFLTALVIEVLWRCRDGREVDENMEKLEEDR